MTAGGDTDDDVSWIETDEFVKKMHIEIEKPIVKASYFTDNYPILGREYDPDFLFESLLEMKEGRDNHTWKL